MPLEILLLVTCLVIAILGLYLTLVRKPKDFFDTMIEQLENEIEENELNPDYDLPSYEGIVLREDTDKLKQKVRILKQAIN